ncbi:uncharacterized protein LOC119742848 [Patiria miniata]|uniref:Uncharacterized protein n=1 Tax=Patiria miniata TaxID=46514 RepID=A0A914BHS1_PATMI|nr:uncharacterized protein LOC119742848 [Patiria miniata]
MIEEVCNDIMGDPAFLEDVKSKVVDCCTLSCQSTMDMMKFLLTLVLMMDMSFRFADAGDFALLVDIANATIYAGSMSQRLADAEALPLSGLVSPVAVDYDPVEKMVYWTDRGSQPTHKISRARLDGSNQMIVVDDLRMVVEW